MRGDEEKTRENCWCEAEENDSSVPLTGIQVFSAEDDEFFEADFADDGLDEEEQSAPVEIVKSTVIESLPDVSLAKAIDTTECVCCIASYQSDGNTILIAAGSTDERLRIYAYNVPKKALVLIQTLNESTESIVDVAFSHDGVYVAAASYDGVVYVYRINPPHSLCLVQRLEGPAIDIEWLRWHPKGYAIIAGSKDATVWMWWATTGNVMHVFSGHTTPVSCGCFGNNGKSICTGSADGTVIVWNPKTGEKTFSFGATGNASNAKHSSPYHTEPLTCLISHPTLPLIASASEDGTVRLVNVVTGRLIGVLEGHLDSVESISFSLRPDSATGAELLASGSLDGTARVWDCNRLVGRSILTHCEPKQSGTNNTIVGGVTRVEWVYPSSPTMLLLVTASTDCTLRVWNVYEQQCLKILSGHKEAVLSMTVFNSSSSSFAASGGDDGTLRVWCLVGGEEQRSQ